MWKRIPTIIIIGIIASAVFVAGRRSAPDRVLVKTDTTYVTRAAPVVKSPPPKEVIVYRTRIERDTIRIGVPTGMQVEGVIGANPIRVRRRSVVLRAFNPELNAFTDSVYNLKPRRFTFNVYTFAGTVSVNSFTDRRLTLGAEAQLYYKRLGIGVRASILPPDGLQYETTVRYRLW